MNANSITRCTTLLLSVTLVSCAWYEEVKTAVEAERLSAESSGGVVDDVVRETLGRASAERVNSGPRGPHALRLWVGVWCDRSGAADGTAGTLDVQVDGVLLSSVEASCENPTEPPMARPNATAFALTVPGGSHVVTLSSPDGAPVTQSFSMSDDKWVMIHHSVGPGAVPETTIEFANDLIAADLGYDPQNAPGAQPGVDYVATGDAERDRRRARRLAENEERERRLAELNARSAPPLRRGQNNTPYRIEERGRATPSRSEPEAQREEPSDSSSRTRRRAASGERSEGQASAADGDWNDASLGRVSVRSQTVLNVWIDGRSIGQTTPVENYALPEGRHRVELRNNAGDVVRSFALDVEPGRSRTLLN